MQAGENPPRAKGDKRARTRARLLDAALALTREKGFEQTTVQDIAERAGVSTGSIYGNFRNRDELFMALAERQWGPIRPAYRPGASFADLMEATAAATVAAIAEPPQMEVPTPIRTVIFPSSRSAFPAAWAGLRQHRGAGCRAQRAAKLGLGPTR